MSSCHATSSETRGSMSKISRASVLYVCFHLFDSKTWASAQSARGLTTTLVSPLRAKTSGSSCTLFREDLAPVRRLARHKALEHINQSVWGHAALLTLCDDCRSEIEHHNVRFDASRRKDFRGWVSFSDAAESTRVASRCAARSADRRSRTASLRNTLQ